MSGSTERALDALHAIADTAVDVLGVTPVDVASSLIEHLDRVHGDNDFAKLLDVFWARVDVYEPEDHTDDQNRAVRASALKLGWHLDGLVRRFDQAEAR